MGDSRSTLTGNLNINFMGYFKGVVTFIQLSPLFVSLPVCQPTLQLLFIIIIIIARPSVSTLASNMLECIGVGNKSAQFYLTWSEPENMDSFDLDYYNINVTTPNSVTNVRSVQPFTIINMDIATIMESADINFESSGVSIDIVAVSKCGQRGMSNPTSVQLQCTNCYVQPKSNNSANFKPSIILCSLLYITVIMLLHLLLS